MAPPTAKKYEHEEFPRMLYRAHPTSGEVMNVVVPSQEAMDAKLKEGWVDHPDSVVSVESEEPISATEAQSLRMRIEQLEQENADLKASTSTANAKKAKKTDGE